MARRRNALEPQRMLLSVSMRTDENAEWPPIDLAWRQTLAAFWSITWPSGLAMFILMLILLSALPTDWAVDDLAQYGLAINLAINLMFFLCQAVLIPHLVRKGYRFFRVD